MNKSALFLSIGERTVGQVLVDAGFRLSDQEQSVHWNTLTYKNSSTTLKISYATYEGEINLHAIFSKTNFRCELAHIMQALHPEQDTPTYLQASTSERLENTLSRIAHALENRGSPLFGADPAFLDRVAEAKRISNERNKIHHNITPALQRARAAWSEKKLNETIRLYELIESRHLTAVDLARLSYARSHRRSNHGKSKQ